MNNNKNKWYLRKILKLACENTWERLKLMYSPFCTNKEDIINNIRSCDVWGACYHTECWLRNNYNKPLFEEVEL